MKAVALALVLFAAPAIAQPADPPSSSPPPAGRPAPSPAMQAARAKVREVCAADIRTYCADAQPGQGGVMRCIRENAEKMSDPCKAALVDMRAARSAPTPPG